VTWPIGRADPAVGSFLPWLIAAAAATDGPILELGAGHFSTPWLASYAAETKREVWTYEYDSVWAEAARRINPNVAEKPSEIPDRQWSVVLVDCEGWTRRAFVYKLRARTEVFVIHDSQDPWVPEDVLASFQYRVDSEDEPRTSVVSDSSDIPNLLARMA
jgi:hypothetical protein